MKKAFIIPTGDEISNGTVLDLDCPEIMRILLKKYPQLYVARLAPVLDVESNIIRTMEECHRSGADLIVLVGGSGGGHRYSATLGKDYTHSALESWLDEKVRHEIYGKNGHMWSKLVCGRKGNTLVCNVPGPLKEASAAAEAFVGVFSPGVDLKVINEAMVQAVVAQYPV